jgi:hypothetical protein
MLVVYIAAKGYGSVIDRTLNQTVALTPQAKTA